MIHAISCRDPLRPVSPSGALAQFTTTLDTAVLGRAIRALGRSLNSRTTHLSESSAFWIASITKSLTAAAVLRLEAQGLLSVHDSLHRFFPAVPIDKRAITLHQLLTHTAGLGGTYTGGGVIERPEAVRRILAQPLIYPPGHGYQYGDDDYELLAAVIEVVTGQSWREVVQHELLDPARLRHIGFWCGPWRNLPRPTVSINGTPSTCDAEGVADWGHRGANGMAATADDLLAWARVLRSETPDGVREFAAIETPQVLVRREGPFDISCGYGPMTRSISRRTFMPYASARVRTTATRICSSRTPSGRVLIGFENDDGWLEYRLENCPE